MSLVNAFEYHILIESMNDLRSMNSNDATKKFKYKTCPSFQKNQCTYSAGSFPSLQILLGACNVKRF